MQKIKKEQGITLIVLVITVIVLLILADITIKAITGENGIIENAGKVKEEAEIANEKEILEKAIVQAMGNNKYGNIEESELQNQLDKETEKGKTEVNEMEEEFEIAFIESKRYYIVDKEGNVGEVQDMIEDKHPGDITVGKNGETLDGSEKYPYEIWCIEDLVKFSQMVNEENKSFVNQYVILKTNLNFESSYSYINPDTTEFDTYLEGDGTTSLIKQLSKNENGFVPIGRDIFNKSFKGTFDGEKHMIKNIYINQSSNAGLFGAIGWTSRTKICNLTVEGNIVVGEGEANPLRAGGIVAWAGNAFIENCHSAVAIKGKASGMGGIVGICQYGDVEIINCTNKGEIENTYYTTGGIIGANQSGISVDIVNTYNLANAKGTQQVGGIIGVIGGTTNIFNCYQQGNITGSIFVGGIIGSIQGNVILRNAYNIGNINCSNTYGGIIGRAEESSKIDCDYVYYKKADNLVGIYNENDSDFQIDGYTEEEWNNTQIATLLNEGRLKQEENINKQEWKTWKLGEDGYPVFE